MHELHSDTDKVACVHSFLNTAFSCFQGINGLSLSRENIEILGNMACTLDGSYIQNADPLILEKLKACNDFSASQVAAMETLLLSGTTQYGYNDKNTSFCQEFKKHN